MAATDSLERERSQAECRLDGENLAWVQARPAVTGVRVSAFGFAFWHGGGPVNVTATWEAELPTNEQVVWHLIQRNGNEDTSVSKHASTSPLNLTFILEPGRYTLFAEPNDPGALTPQAFSLVAIGPIRIADGWRGECRPSI